MKSAPALRMHAFTPLRYPGGKGKLAAYVKSIIEQNGICDGTYIEPYAGGAGIALELLFQEYVSTICINDLSRPIWAFWNAALNQTEQLVKLVNDTPLSVKQWDKQKRILKNADESDDLSLGFATFYLNRTNRSGILNGGIIGGRDQTGPWKIDARYNAKELSFRIESIASMRSRIKLTRKDAYSFLSAGLKKWDSSTLVYLDPPYYQKGKDLYLDYYEHDDHMRIAELMKAREHTAKWIVSYDNDPEIRAMYKGCRKICYSLAYSAREAREGTEVMFFSKSLSAPSLLPSMKKAA